MSTNKQKNQILRTVSALTIVVLIAVMAWLTLSDPDPCANPQSDISGAAIADPDGDQDALVNRAIIMKGKCDKE